VQGDTLLAAPALVQKEQWALSTVCCVPWDNSDRQNDFVATT